MNTPDRKRIIRAIRSTVPGLHEVGRVLAATPRGSVLRGFCIESSSDPKRAYVWAFVQPLYVPATTIVLSLGERLGGPSRTWGAEDTTEISAIARDHGVPFFDPIRSAAALCSWPLLAHRADEYSKEARAYSLLLAGRVAEATGRLRELADGLSNRTAWAREMGRRDRDLAALAESDPGAAVELLAKWEADTLVALHLQGLP